MDAMMIMMYGQLCNYVLLCIINGMRAFERWEKIRGKYPELPTMLVWTAASQGFNPQFQIGTVKHIQIIQYVY